LCTAAQGSCACCRLLPCLGCRDAASELHAEVRGLHQRGARGGIAGVQHDLLRDRCEARQFCADNITSVAWNRHGVRAIDASRCCVFLAGERVGRSDRDAGQRNSTGLANCSCDDGSSDRPALRLRC
jgi:hypothetical protein